MPVNLRDDAQAFRSSIPYITDAVQSMSFHHGEQRFALKLKRLVAHRTSSSLLDMALQGSVSEGLRGAPRVTPLL